MGFRFQFGETVDGYDYRVLNERTARASAGIMFLFGIISFLIFIMRQNLFWAELFSLTFLLEFGIRVLVNPLYAPYMVLGSLFVANQHPDWVEAKPKKFAWVLGLILGAVMGYFILFGVLSPLRMLTCVVCLILLFTESVFGICLGCLLYQKFHIDVQNCPGGVCDTPTPKRGNIWAKVALLTAYAVLFAGSYQALVHWKYTDTASQMTAAERSGLEQMIAGSSTPASPPTSVATVPAPSESAAAQKDATDCTPPQWAVAMGHKELWKKHHHCE